MSHRIASLATTLALVPLSLAHAQVVNAPVAPEAIYVGRAGSSAGLSVIDLNGFGQGTGNPAFDPTYQTFPEGNSNFPNDPNVKLQGSLLMPPLAPGTTTLDGGSAGVFTLAKNSALEDVLLRAPSIGSISDLMLGHPLDTVFNNGPAPSGCQAGGGNLCAADPVQVVAVGFGPQGTLVPSPGSPTTAIGLGNPISFAPHPNPPPLRTTPLCHAPWIGAQEPTSVHTLALGLVDLLVPGDPFGNPANGIPPSGVLAFAENSFFVGPSLPQASLPACEPYQVRQQVGHFLYAADREVGEVVVLNSNTMRVLARIAVADATELAMSPDLDLLAVTQRSLDRVAFVDIDPGSPTFHQVVATTQVGDAPCGIAWEAGGEDVLVCNEGSSSVSILSAATLTVRKTVRRGLEGPFAVATTQRQAGFGHGRNVYFAYVLDRAGRVSLFESGPSGVNGWGYDDVVLRTSFAFPRAKAIQADPLRLESGVWIAHERQLGLDGTPTGLDGGALTKLVLDASTTGVIPLTVLDFLTPNPRGLSLRIERSVGSDQLTGVPLDLAFDDLVNLGALPNVASPFSPGRALPLNGKSQVRVLFAGTYIPTNRAQYALVPVRQAGPGTGAVDVIRLADGVRIDVNAHHPGVQSIPASGASVVAAYFRQ